MSNELVDVLKALADPTRLDIVRWLTRHGELSCARISRRFPLAQPTLSHYFRKLLAAGVLTERKQGVRHFYRVNARALRALGFNSRRLLTK